MSSVDPRLPDAPASHPDADTVVAYAEGRLLESAAGRVADHLETCDECRELIADLRSYPDLPPPVDEDDRESHDAYAVSTAELDATLASLLARHHEADAAGSTGVEAESEPPAAPRQPQIAAVDIDPEEAAAEATDPSETTPTETTPGETAPRWPGAHWLWAALALAAISWGWFERAARDDLQSALHAPRANTPIIALQAMDNPLRSADIAPVDASNGVVFTVADDDPFPAGDYRIRIVLGDGESLEIDGLSPWPAGHLSFFVPAGALDPGSREIIILRPDGTEWPRRFVLEIGP